MTATGPGTVVPIGDLLAAIVSERDAGARDLLVNDFIAATEPITRGVAAGLCREFRADRTTWHDDFCQIVRIAAHTLVTELVEHPHRLAEVGSWRGLLTFRARSAATAFVDSSAGFNPASGMVAVKRRVREMEKTRALLLAELEREPTDHEVVERTNRRLAAIRSDYKRQGMECRLEDLQLAAPAEDITDHHDRLVHDALESDSDLHATERAQLIRLCIEACTAESAQLGQIARIWFAPALGTEYDAHPNATQIAAVVGVEPSTARARVARLRQIARTVAQDRYGIRRTLASRPA
ncbi:hypothetical protein [Nocardioides sp. SYSU DS0651]|uniref:hypothetical protein n=1 Tax=Nocardioides sp. SYSU DS0651 TaxID=3415955 RepID=UPI003F4B7E37